MRQRHAARPILRRALTGAAAGLGALALGAVAACGGDLGGGGAFSGSDVALTPAPSAGTSAAPTPPVFTGNRISLANADNGTHIAAPLGSDLLVRLSVPLDDDCQGGHMCVVWQVDDSAGVLLRTQEMTTCDKDACTAQREVFLAHAGTATLSLLSVEQCSPSSGVRCELKPHATLWSAHVSVGNGG